jgi:hypothetical protein
VYTAKTFFAADQLIRTGFFPPGSSLLLVHSGGLQGNRSLPRPHFVIKILQNGDYICSVPLPIQYV